MIDYEVGDIVVYLNGNLFSQAKVLKIDEDDAFVEVLDEKFKIGHNFNGFADGLLTNNMGYIMYKNSLRKFRPETDLIPLEIRKSMLYEGKHIEVYNRGKIFVEIFQEFDEYGEILTKNEKGIMSRIHLNSIIFDKITYWEE